jgi:hypothetical protein
MDDPGFESRQRQGVLLFFKASRLAVGLTQPLIQWVPLFLSPAVQRPGPQVYHSPSSSAKVENEWSYLYMYSWRKKRNVYLLSRIIKIRPRLVHSRSCLFILHQSYHQRYIFRYVGRLYLSSVIILLAWCWCALGRSVRSVWDRLFCAKHSGWRREVATIQFVIWNCYFCGGCCGLYVIAPWEESKSDSGTYAFNGWNHASHCRVLFFFFFFYKEARR